MLSGCTAGPDLPPSRSESPDAEFLSLPQAPDSPLPAQKQGRATRSFHKE